MKTKKFVKILRVLLIIFDYLSKLLKQLFASSKTKPENYEQKEEDAQNPS